MSIGRNLLWIGIVALLGFIVWQEVRFTRQLRVMHALFAEREAQRAEAARAQAELPDSTAALASQLQATRSQLLETRADLVTARRQLTNNANQIAALERQMQTFARQAPPVRSIRSVSFTEDGTGLTRGRPWGEEQVVGPPDTHQSGDISTAWASKLPDGGEEWLKLDYSNAVWLAEVRVRETYNPGAISRVAAVLPNGSEITLWEGVADPVPAPADSSFAVPGNIQAASVKVYLDTRRVRGWNEIDAVELVGRDGSRQWAAQAAASSSYADVR